MPLRHFMLVWLAAVAVLILGGCAMEKPKVAMVPEIAPSPRPVREDMTVAPHVREAGAGEAVSEAVAAAPPRPGMLFVSELPYLEQRLAVYQDELARWQQLDERFFALDIEEDRPAGWYQCVLQLEQAATSYSRIRDQLLAAKGAGAAPSGPVKHGEGYRLDIGYLEGNCDEVYKVGEIAVNTWLGKFADTAAGQLEATVSYYVENGMDDQAVSAYQNLRAAYPRHRVAPEVTTQYSLALFRAGRVDDALAALRGQISGGGPTSGHQAIQRLLADLLFVSGRTEEAKAEYQGLSDFFADTKESREWVKKQLALLNSNGASAEETALFTKVLRSFLLFDGKHMPQQLKEAVKGLEARFPGSALAERAGRIKWRAEQRVSAWVGRQLVVADDLVEEKEFRKAITMLEGLLAEDLTGEVRRVVQETLDGAVLAENEELKAQKQLRDQMQAMQWDEATRLLGLRKYDEAIAAFTVLLGTEYDERAKQKIDEAAHLAATDMRREAAGLFVKARKATEPEQKKEWIIASWRLLKQIAIKYPEVDILPKVLENLKVIEGQISRIDPSLLDSLSVFEETSQEPDPSSSKEENIP